MIISPLELESLVGNSALGENIRKALGTALQTAVYEPGRAYEDNYAALGNPEAYDCPDDELLILFAEYLQEQTAGMLLDVEL